MNERLALYELAQAHQLDRLATARLFQLAGLDQEPVQARRRVWQAAALLAAGLVGLGLVLWVAANWESLGRIGRFALLQGVVVVMGLGTVLRPAARAPLGLLALLGVGALFAYFGQTYQTGADAWQLFALWAALTLPLGFAVRHDAVWAPWTLIAAVGIALWAQTHTGHQWRVQPDDLVVHAIGWAALGVLCALLSPPLARFTGAGAWSLRTALTLAVIALTMTAIGALFHKSVAPHYVLGLVLLAAAAVWFSRPAFFEVYGLSAVAMGLNSLLVGGLVRLLFNSGGSDPVGALLMTGLVAAGLLAGSVHLILKLSRAQAAREAA